MLTILRESVLRDMAPYPFKRPIFIVAPPCSGAALLHHCLSQCPSLYSMRQETDAVWDTIFPRERPAQCTDYIDPADVTPGRVRALRRSIYTQAAYASREHRPWTVLHRLGLQPIRYLDGSPANCFRLNAIHRAFPDAHYVFLVRDPRAAIGRMMANWTRNAHHRSHLDQMVQRMEGTTLAQWSYPVPPGWREVATRPLSEVCAWSWAQHVEYALSFFEATAVDPVRVRYETLRDDPDAATRHLAHLLDLTNSDERAASGDRPPASRPATHDARSGAGASQSHNTIRSIVPTIRDTAGQIGYTV